MDCFTARRARATAASGVPPHAGGGQITDCHARRARTAAVHAPGARARRPKSRATVRSMVRPSSAMRLRTMGRISRGFTPQTRRALELMINVAASRRKLSLL